MFFVLVVLSVIGGSLAATEQAGDAELLYSEVHKGYNYHIYGKATWFMAMEICSAHGMKLVRIEERNKNDEVTYFISKLAAITGPYWTLATRLYDDITWAFAIGDPVKYFNWAPGKPDNAGGNEKCIEIYQSGEWSDKDCAAERIVLCESKA